MTAAARQTGAPAASAAAADRSAARRAGFARYAWFVLGFNLLVVLWGASVRATGSGAGCGSHWPLCNGEIVPRAPAAATAIEFTHRATSGLALLLVAGLVVGAWRRFPRAHAVRRGAAWSALFLVVEALLGAGLVLLEYVADDARAARGIWVAGHLVNTMLLLGALALTAWSAIGGERRRVPVDGATIAALGLAIVGMLVLATSGAVTALGDTLFPAATWAEGKALTFSADAHLFVRLRLWHPTLALVVGIALVAAVFAARRARPGAAVRNLGGALVAIYAAQLLLGLANMRLLAPVGLQIAHLLFADVTWIALVLLVAEVVAPVAVSSPAEARTATAGASSADQRPGATVPAA